MNEFRQTKNEDANKIQDDSIYDSGVVSGTNLESDEFMSGEIIDDSPSRSDPTPPKDNKTKTTTSEILMSLDSGVDIGIDQYTSSSLDLQASSSTQSFSDTLSSSNSQSQIESKSNKSEYAGYPWQLFFEQDDDGNTQLHIAVLDDLVNVIRSLLQVIPSSVYLDMRNDYSQTALHLCVLTRKAELLKTLIQCGARTDIVDCDGNTALHLACQINDLDCVKTLLNANALTKPLNFVQKYNSNIDLAYKYINAYNYQGMTCSHLAAAHKNQNMLRYLFEYGADINIRECRSGYTILHEATLSGNYELVRDLLKHPNLDIEKKTYARLTAYQLSVEYPRISSLLVKNGATALPFPSYDDYSDSEDEDDDEFDLNQVANSFILNKSASNVARTVVTTS